MIENNENEVQGKLLALNTTNITEFAQEYNALFGTAYASTEYMCTDGCDTCYDGVCAMLETMEESFLDYTETNFTAEDFLSGMVYLDVTPFTMNFTYAYTECAQYTSGTTLDGKLCFGFYSDPTLIALDIPCTLEYDDIACNSCFFPRENELECYIADCTNIDASAMINSCNKTGFVGPFIFLGLLEVDNATSISLTVGSCDGLSAPTSPTVPVTMSPTSNDAPVTASMAPTPVDAPVTTPTAPISFVAPVTTPIAPTAVNSPVKAPVKTSTVTMPTAPTTSGSSVLGISMNGLVFVFGTIAMYFF
jgi:hypothetical protein